MNYHFYSSYVLYKSLVLNKNVKECLNEIGATFVPPPVHPDSLSWPCIRLHDTTGKCHVEAETKRKLHDDHPHLVIFALVAINNLANNIATETAKDATNVELYAIFRELQEQGE